MRRLEFLISEARRSTNTTDINSVSNFLCQDYMNRICSFLEDHLFAGNSPNDLFMSDYIFQLVPGQDEYALPPHIYAKSSIDNMAVSFLNGLSNTYLPLKKVSRKQQGFTFGYFIREDKIVLTPRPTSPLNIKMAYVRKLPTVSLRGGQVSVIGNPLTLTGTIAGFTDSSDYVCVVDKDGVIKEEGLEVVSLVANALTLNSVTGIIVGDYIVSGKYATSHCQFPDECEKFMITALERMIQYRQSSPDIQNSNMFTSEELSIIKEVFADNSYDDAKPPVTEWQEWLP